MCGVALLRLQLEIQLAPLPDKLWENFRQSAPGSLLAGRHTSQRGHFRSTRGNGGVVVRTLFSHQGEPGSISGRVAPDFLIWDSCRTMSLIGGFSRGSPVSPTSSFRRCSTLDLLPYNRNPDPCTLADFSSLSGHDIFQHFLLPILATVIMRVDQYSSTTGPDHFLPLRRGMYSNSPVCLSYSALRRCLQSHTFLQLDTSLVACFYRSSSIAKTTSTYPLINPRARRPRPGNFDAPRVTLRETRAWGHGGRAISTLASHQGEPDSIPGRVTGFSQIGIVPDDAIGRRVFSGISRFPRPFITGGKLVCETVSAELNSRSGNIIFTGSSPGVGEHSSLTFITELSAAVRVAPEPENSSSTQCDALVLPERWRCNASRIGVSGGVRNSIAYGAGQFMFYHSVTLRRSMDNSAQFEGACASNMRPQAPHPLY
ncbi:hypothetical protein PR048_017855 [Dryococelus australis]|uniref:Uncharacterized protein n=1 Tax=Dryococelus australis TaxID=614101 RepID=A0ABQ9HAS6_9NEOP|nr:hypothetical protein PR048_017855 [Dryococelus australis]